MKSTRRVAITGIGMISGLGHNVFETWRNALEGKSGISTLEYLPTHDLAVKFGGEVKNFTISNHLLEPKEAPRYDKFIHYALHATDEAIKQANIPEGHYSKLRMGCILGVGMGGFPIIEHTHKEFLEKGSRRVSPFFIPSVIPNMASGMISIQWGLMGLNYTIASACASSAHAVSAAAYEIMLGRQDIVISGGAESVITNLTINGFNNMKALSKRNDEPQRASRPFDIDRDGFVMGEGAGILVLEDYEKAVARGATILAEVVGHGATSDANHITAPHPEGDGAYACMTQAIEFAGIKKEQIGYVNAHGTSTGLGDIAETKAIKRTFGDHAKNLVVSSTKSMTGHLLGAAGGVETIFCVLALKNQIIPPTINLENQDPQCDLNYAPNKPVKANIEYALNNSFGFGGTNSSAILKRV
ncbi:MAG: beta-ketoacyl-ACP synthase II [Bacteriovoracaceae bacterium]